jgi:hypothetical protein
MIRYYSLIRRALCALESNTKAERYALYERVRNALAEILRASDPSPTEPEIVDECLALDAAIDRAEAAYTLLDTLTHLPPGARRALRSALDAMRRTETPLPFSALVPALKSARIARARQSAKRRGSHMPVIAQEDSHVSLFWDPVSGSGGGQETNPLAKVA